MPVNFQAWQLVDRPIAVVFRFCAYEHVRNHPRWDPDIELEQISPGPIGVGTLIHRVNSRSGKPLEGTMEVVEFKPNQVIGVITHDGPLEMRGRMTFEAVNEAQTIVTSHAQLPDDLADALDTDFLERMMTRSLRNIKQLIESEYEA